MIRSGHIANRDWIDQEIGWKLENGQQTYDFYPKKSIKDTRPLCGVMAVSEIERNSEIDIETSIKSFLYCSDYLHEFRLQIIAYLGELVAIQRGRGKLTEATFKPYMYGSYSEEIRETLYDIEDQLTAELDYHQGRATIKYKYEDRPNIGERDLKLIREICDSTKNLTNDELKTWCKGTYLYKTTPYDSHMKFEDYQEEFENGNEEIDSDIMDDFPELLRETRNRTV